MFRMMKLRQNVKGKVLSFAVSLATLALTIVGAFAVNFDTADAFISGGSIVWGTFKEQVLAEFPLELWPASGTGSFAYFENEFKNRINNKNYFISLAWKTSSQGFLDEFSMCIIRTNSTGTFEWANDEVGLMDTLGGTRYISDGFIGFSCSKTTGIKTYSNYGSYVGSSFNRQVDFSNTVKWANTIAVRNQETAACWFSQDVYSRANGSLISTKNLFDDPQSAYDNLIIKTGDRYYFTITDQYIIRTAAAGDEGFLIEFEDSSYPGVYKQYYNNAIDFTYMSIYAYPNVTNISPNGILAWDITDIINYSTYDKLVYSSVSGDHPTWFGDNVVDITRDNVPDPWTTYYDYVNNLLDLLDGPNHITSDDPPSYVSSNVYTSYKDLYVAGGAMSDAGNVILNELPSVPFDTIVVCSDKLFDDLGNKVDILSVSTSTTAFINYLSPYLLQQIDLIVVLPDDAFNNALQGQPDHPDNFVNWNPYSWNIGVASGRHGYFYYTSPTIRDVSANDVSGFAFCTQRYLDKCRNYMLSDGIRQLYEGLNAITENQDSIITAIVNGAGSVYSSIQLCYGRLDNIYNLLNDINLSSKLQDIIDKLDRIADNTSEQTHDYWFISLYNWLLQFAPNNSDFATWVSDLTSFENQLPDPEATPAATVIPFPTVTAAAG